jgi:hypothetical protein
MIFLGGSAEMNFSPTRHLIKKEINQFTPRPSLSLKGEGLGRDNATSCKSLAFSKTPSFISNHSIEFPTQIHPPLLFLLSEDSKIFVAPPFINSLNIFNPRGSFWGWSLSSAASGCFDPAGNSPVKGLVSGRSLSGAVNVTTNSKSVKNIFQNCVSKIEMSPITAKLKCPHGRGKDTDESEAVTEVRGDGFG